MNRLDDRDVVSAALAARLALELGLPPGNKWEVSAAKVIREEMYEFEDDTFALMTSWRERLGLERKGEPDAHEKS